MKEKVGTISKNLCPNANCNKSGQQKESFQDGIYTMPVFISQNQCDGKGILRLGEMARLMQAIAEKHFKAVYGIGSEELDPQHKGLVICWMAMEINKLPQLGDNLFLKLWQGVGRATMESRRAILTDASGNVLLTIAGLYLWMDRLERKMTSVPEEIKDKIKVYTFPDEPKLPRMKAREPAVYSNETWRKVKDSEIDHNGHVNNSFYLDWTEEILNAHHVSLTAPASVWVQYNHELMKDSTLKLKYVLDGEQIWVNGSVEEQTSFLIKISFSSVNDCV